jgi:F-type H+-transporting ATPase subunit delta
VISKIKLLGHKYAQAYMKTLGVALTFSEYERFRAFGSFIKTYERSLVILSVPVLSDYEKRAALERLSALYELPASINALWALLIEHKRIVLVPACVEELCELFERRENIQRFTISSSHELDVQSVALIKDYLERATGKKVVEELALDKRLIAGIRLQSNDYVWEYSVRKQIRTLRVLLANKGSYGH